MSSAGAHVQLSLPNVPVFKQKKTARSKQDVPVNSVSVDSLVCEILQ
jgi:hypothetical protein